MKYVEVGKSGVKASNVIMGCLRLKDKTPKEAEQIIGTAMEEGINFFDHADVYGNPGRRGECEEVFGKALPLSRASFREKIIIQTKCGIVKKNGNFYDFSKEHIVEAAEASLKRLGTEYLDFLLLHRPDTLMEPEEVAAAFETLERQGKVRHFGVSNHRPLQIELLQKYIPYKLEVNQLQLGIAHCPMIDSGINVNSECAQAYDKEGSVLEYSRLHEMTIQAWSPFQKSGPVSSSSSRPFLGDYDTFGELNRYILQIAENYGVTDTAVAVAWLTRHPANIQVILGSMNPQRIKDACRGSELPLTREEWYGIYQASGKVIP